MRLLTVVTEAPPIRSGVAEVAHHLTEGLRDLGHEVDHVTSAHVGRRSVGEVRLTGMAAHWREMRARVGEYDAINLHGPAPTFSDVFLGLWRTLPPESRPPLLYTHHSDIDLHHAWPLCAAYNRLHARLVGVADHVVVSTGSYADIVRRAGATAVTVLPHGLDATTEAAWAPRRGPFTVAFVGQLRPYKGVDALLRAAAMLPDVAFEVVGGGHREPSLRSLASRLGLSNVHWHGPVTDESRDALLRRAHVVVLPSTTRAEAFGLVLLEGMAVGAVPIASALPGVRDVASRSGLLCRPSDPRSLVQAICYLRDDPDDWERRSRQSLDEVRAFSWETTVLGYQRILTEELRRRSGVAEEVLDDLRELEVVGKVTRLPRHQPLREADEQVDSADQGGDRAVAG